MYCEVRVRWDCPPLLRLDFETWEECVDILIVRVSDCLKL